MKTLHQALSEAGCELDHHESDLYVRDTPEARAIIAQYPTHDANKERFKSQTGDGMWLDIPFAYDTFWLSRGVGW